MLESTRGTRVLPERCPVIYAFLYYLYTDMLDPDLDHQILCEILVMANMYLLDRLRKLAAATLYERHLNVDTCVRIFQAACLAQEQGLKRLSHEFILRNCGAVMKTEGWLLLWSAGGAGGGHQRNCSSSLGLMSRRPSSHAETLADGITTGGDDDGDFDGRTEAMSPSSDMGIMRSVMDEFIEGISDDASLIIVPDLPQSTEQHANGVFASSGNKK